MTTRRSPLVLAVGMLLVLGGCRGSTDVPEPRPTTESSADPGSALVVAADGSGDQCSASSPCDLETALATAPPGATVSLLPGTYPPVRVTETSNGDRVSLTAADDADRPTLEGLDYSRPGLTLSGLRVSGLVRIRGPATGATLEDLDVVGGSVTVESEDVVVRDSQFTGGADTDAIKIGTAARVTVERNRIDDYRLSAGSDEHVDCIQVFDSSQVVIRQNQVSNCANAGIILSTSKLDLLDDILIEGNFIQGCVTPTPECPSTPAVGGAAADLRHPSARGLVVRSNTILDGAFRHGDQPGVVVDRNIIGYLSSCETPLTRSVILRWNPGLCSVPEQLGVEGNRAGPVDFVDEGSGDLRPLTRQSVVVDAAGSDAGGALAIDGTPLPPDIAGAALP